MTLRYAVVGAGNGGTAMAAELSLLGRDLVLVEMPGFENRLKVLREAGGIVVESRIDHFPGGVGTRLAPISRMTTDMSAISDANVVIVIVPAQHHDKVIARILPHLKAGQLVLLNPGGVGGALLWSAALRSADIRDVLIAQPSDLLYAGFRTPEGKAVVADKKKKAALGIFPNADREVVMQVVADVFPEFQPAANVLEAGMGGPGMLVHPLPMLMNAVRIDRDTPFKYDAYDITPSVARAVEKLDAERTAIIDRLGGRPLPIKDVLTEYYGVTGVDFYETVRHTPPYLGSSAPADFSHRYISEEVPTQIVPSASIGRQLGVATPIMDATIALASAVAGSDYAVEGWTAVSLGIDGLDADAIRTLLETGRR
ncbi:MAG: opine dehydrogenase [Bradyrhizobium sp.]|nr:opine dehydrogenase [Bradyrhizobium sp.]